MTDTLRGAKSYKKLDNSNNTFQYFQRLTTDNERG